MIAANFSGGSLPDLVAVSPVTDMISIFHYDGFAFRLRGTLKAGSAPQAIVAADFNGDGRLDLAAVDYDSNDVSVFLGEGGDRFGVGRWRAALTGTGPIALAGRRL